MKKVGFRVMCSIHDPILIQKTKTYLHVCVSSEFVCISQEGGNGARTGREIDQTALL